MVQIKQEFEALIPKLTTDEFDKLESSILNEGVRDPIITWQDNIVDGHNRYNIAIKHGIEFKTIAKEFDSEEDAKIWMINNQFGRRNLGSFDRSILALELEKELKIIAERNQKGGLGVVDSQGRVRDKLANTAKVSNKTIDKVKKIIEKAPVEIQDNIRRGDTTITEVYNNIMKDQKKEELKNKIQESKDNGVTIPSTITLLEGDLFDKVKEVQDKSIDMVLVDPPYWMNKGDWDSFDNYEHFYKFTEDWIKLILPKLKDTYQIFISFNSEYFYMLETICRGLKLPIKSRLIWHYRNAGGKSSGKSCFSKTYEPILHIGNKELNFPDIWNDERFDVWTIAVPQSNFTDGKFHPTQKPLELFNKLVLFGSKEGDTVMDIFAGSGTTGLSCKKCYKERHKRW